jgi:hypothetical protein
MTYKSGWIGLRSVPRTAAFGCSWAGQCQKMLVWKEDRRTEFNGPDTGSSS